eukprot:TRINITY_DN21503_c0_g1_i2.p1 TRINITY_DN21503_c0_g1~~TRINITY_DN21503_c0_g1_i2.p1  ORF type:complete len:313 (-),score=88.29 TRINITY_DN21503_c0_g1_i2:98-1036(-)
MGNSEIKSKEGTKLIKSYQKKHRNLTQSSDDRHMKKLFNLYGGKKGYLDELQAKAFIKDVLIVSDLTSEIENLPETINLIFEELDSTNTKRVTYQELLKPTWAKVQELLNNAYSKMNTLKTNTTAQPPPQPSPPTPQTLKPQPAVFIDPVILEDADGLELEECCPPSFICPISQAIMSDPVLLIETGTTYDRPFIEKWFQTKNTDPSTGLEVKNKTLVSVLALKNSIEEWKTSLLEKQKKRKTPSVSHGSDNAKESENDEKFKVLPPALSEDTQDDTTQTDIPQILLPQPDTTQSDDDTTPPVQPTDLTSPT